MIGIGQRRACDDGLYTVELVLWTPALVLLAMLAVTAGRIVSANNQAVEASRDAARAASLSFTMPQARAAANTAARDALGRADITCTSLRVTITGSVRPGGVVTAQVWCTADLHDIALPGVPGAKTLTGSSSAPIEITRSGPNSGAQP
jgi:Flp pilus assembly protein TadG